MRHSFPSHPKSAYTYCLFFLLFVTPTIFAQCSLFLIFETGVFGKILDWSGWQEEEDKKKKNHSKNKQDKETKEYIILAADIGSDKMDNDVGRVTVIPGQWILEIKIII